MTGATLASGMLIMLGTLLAVLSFLGGANFTGVAIGLGAIVTGGMLDLVAQPRRA
jgi:hypothetical protein